MCAPLCHALTQRVTQPASQAVNAELPPVRRGAASSVSGAYFPALATALDRELRRNNHNMTRGAGLPPCAVYRTIVYLVWCASVLPADQPPLYSLAAVACFGVLALARGVRLLSSLSYRRDCSHFTDTSTGTHLQPCPGGPAGTGKLPWHGCPS